MCEQAMQTDFMIQTDYPPRQIRKFVLSLIDGKAPEIAGGTAIPFERPAIQWRKK